jgi:hypothetical protein
VDVLSCESAQTCSRAVVGVQGAGHAAGVAGGSVLRQMAC